MGYIQHQAVLATWWTKEDPKVDELRMKLTQLGNEVDRPERLLVGPVASIVNGYQTLILVPDGSKEGWGTSDIGDQARQVFAGHLREVLQYVDLVEVTYGGDYAVEFGVSVQDLSEEG